ncbi:MAG: dTDP-4-dehydrorhamnose reductase [Rhodocyclaceae bacterium]|nr:dTDP-4-dehydrorhamnose reductase [Rhodocyclaceae bacterium]MCA3073748.1 dTDP-4-dehydrorhamnose reductase [Rhodocyclaceae bacterium]MCA3091731.1 dTDP-4-dehydrorhamnose reductase [Rhodocyclaceae bacterium]MCA3093375.1 dTDP-4-dehydrorhamnose reductase [Rhodocyclaceae bacterium]MCA3096192.1 dTDP-4-dehydrorhamnose reductase [Rhodocyclaceae bacterium]
MTRVLLFGCSGQVGGELARLFGQRTGTLATTGAGTPPLPQPAYELTALDRTGCDLSDPDAMHAAIARAKPQVIVNAAAWTAVDRAEAEPDACRRINTGASAAMAAAARDSGALLVHYSTDYVFDGSARRPYREDDPVAPRSAYGRSKLEGERAIAASGCAAIVLRTSWVYGMTGQNFLRTMLRLANEREELGVVDDQQGSPTWSRSLARATLQLLDAHASEPAAWPRPFGLYHATASGSTTWFGFASAIFELAPGLTRRPRLRPLTTADYPLPAPRPAWSVLDCSRLQARSNLRLPAWRHALAECLAAGEPVA